MNNMPAIYLHVFTSGNDWYGAFNRPVCVMVAPVDTPKSFSLAISKAKTLFIQSDEALTEERKAEWLEKTGYEYDPPAELVCELKEGFEKIHKMLSSLNAKDCVLLGYNHIRYDLELLNASFKSVGLDPIKWNSDRVVDVMKLAEISLDCKKLGSFSMKSVAHCVGAVMMNGADLAKTPLEYDFDLLGRIVEGMEICDKKTWDDLAAICVAPRKIEILTFGKFRGCSLKDVMKIDQSYLAWIMRNPSFREEQPDLINSIRELMRKDV